MALVEGELQDTLAAQQLRISALNNYRKTFMPFTRQ